MDTGIVVGTYNNAAHVDATLASLRAQTHPHWHCVVVDNGSTDATAERVCGLIAGDARFEFHAKANEGPSAGRNAGFRRLPRRAEFIHFLDGDDCLHREFLERMVAYLRAHPAVGLLGCQYDVIDAEGRFVAPGRRSRFAPSRFGWPRALRDGDAATPFETFFAATGQGPFAVFRRSVFERTAGYEEGFWSHEDSDIFCQMALLAEVHYLPERLYAKRVHASNLTGSPRADYGRFRRKWDHYRSGESATDARIERALRYYYGVHAPLRHLKVGLKAAREFLASGRGDKLARASGLMLSGVAELVGRRTLRQRLAERRAAQAR